MCLMNYIPVEHPNKFELFQQELLEVIKGHSDRKLVKMIFKQHRILEVNKESIEFNDIRRFRYVIRYQDDMFNQEHEWEFKELPI